jgi:hypothetical protein
MAEKISFGSRRLPESIAISSCQPGMAEYIAANLSQGKSNTFTERTPVRAEDQKPALGFRRHPDLSPIRGAREKHCRRNVESLAQFLDVGSVEVTFLV